MADKLKPLLKRIDDLCRPIFKLGGDKGVKAKDLEKHYNKGPLSEVAFDLFSCLYESKRQLEELNRHVVKASSALKEQDEKIHELDASLTEKENAEQSILQEILTEVKKNGAELTKIDTIVRENEQKIVTEAGKVSSYAEILRKAATSENKTEINATQQKKLAKHVASEIRDSNRKKNIVLSGISGHYKKLGNELSYGDDMYDALNHLGFPGLKPDSVELLKPARDTLAETVEDGGRVPCTLRLQLPNESIPLRMLKNSPRLKGKFYYDVYIAPDRTVEEQKERSQLVEKLKSLIKEQPQTKWVIRRGRVISAGHWDA